MTELSVRVAGDGDIEAAREVLRSGYAQYESVLPAENWKAYLADILDLEGRAADSELLIAELEGRVVGCVSFFSPGAKTAYPTDAYSEPWPPEWGAFRLLSVDPSARGKGVGRRLTELCIERARAQGAEAVGLHTTEPMSVARAMYERMGFERAPRFDFRAGTVVVEAYRLLLSASE